MHIPYSIEVHDNLVSLATQAKVWHYIQNQTWHQLWAPQKGILNHYVPAVDKINWFKDQGYRKISSMPRCLLASDEGTLAELHAPVHQLWTELNAKLGNRYVIAGIPEGMKDPVEPPVPKDTSLENGWRVYVNAIHNSAVTSGWYAHRDCPDLEDETAVTMLYVLNLEWYPSWGAEVLYFPDDQEGETGDHQQFNLEESQQQRRDFGIGWLDQGRVISPVPGRLIIQDGRCLHGTSLAQNTDLTYPSIKIVFRARRISDTE
jgi:hypothetical protein